MIRTTEFFLFQNNRTPFEQNSAISCATIVLFEAFASVYMSNAFCTVGALFLVSMTYAEACLLDIKSIYLQVNRLSGSKKSESRMIECCKDAVDLHERVIRYFSHSNDFLKIFFSKTLGFGQTRRSLADVSSENSFCFFFCISVCFL